MKEIFNPLKFNQNVKNHSVIDNFLNTIQRAESTLSYGGEKKKKKKNCIQTSRQSETQSPRLKHKNQYGDLKKKKGKPIDEIHNIGKRTI